MSRRHGVLLSELVAAGMLSAGDVLTSTDARYPGDVVLTSGGAMFDGVEYPDLSSATRAVKQRSGGKVPTNANVWRFWAYRGAPLTELRTLFLTGHGHGGEETPV